MCTLCSTEKINLLIYSSSLQNNLKNIIEFKYQSYSYNPYIVLNQSLPTYPVSIVDDNVIQNKNCLYTKIIHCRSNIIVTMYLKKSKEYLYCVLIISGNYS